MLGTPVRRAEYEALALHGGTLGDVHLLTGTAFTADGRSLPFRMVRKTQKRWHRPGDPASWRREYDLAQTDLRRLFTPAFRGPDVYYAECTDDANCLWMEYVEGSSGANLTPEALELAALSLGRFQGRSARQMETLRAIPCLGDAAYAERDFGQWQPETLEYKRLRGADCPLPGRLQRLLIDTQSQAAEVFTAMHALPQVLCHRDYWTENILINGGNVIVIDWDCAGLGAIGEDIASLIADETEPGSIGRLAEKLVPAYYRGLQETISLPPMREIPVREMILIKFGYRFFQQALFAREQAAKDSAILALEQIATL
jgi:hypothetical protein